MAARELISLLILLGVYACATHPPAPVTTESLPPPAVPEISTSGSVEEHPTTFSATDLGSGKRFTVGEWVRFVCEMPDKQKQAEALAATERELHYTFDFPASCDPREAKIRCLSDTPC